MQIEIKLINVNLEFSAEDRQVKVAETYAVNACIGSLCYNPTFEKCPLAVERYIPIVRASYQGRMMTISYYLQLPRNKDWTSFDYDDIPKHYKTTIQKGLEAFKEDFKIWVLYTIFKEMDR